MADTDKDGYRLERDTMGEVKVSSDKFWGAQTQRSIQNFPIGNEAEKMPLGVVKGLAIVKKAAAKVNKEFGLDSDVADAISKAADDVNTIF